MNERLPYEEQLSQQWDSLPLPDENMAWADMKRRLDEDDDRRPVAWWRRGCMAWSFLLLALLGTGWFLLKPEKWFSGKKEQAAVTKKEDEILSKHPDVKLFNDTNKVQLPGKADTGKAITEKITVPGTTEEISKEPGSLQAQKGKISAAHFKATIPVKKRPLKAGVNITSGNKNAESPEKTENNDQAGFSKTTDIKTTDEKTNPPADTVVQTVITTTPADSVKKISSVKTAEQAETYVKKEEGKKKDEKSRTLFVFSAGLGLHQQLPIEGQKLTPYNSLGRKGSIADYIPSGYVRMEKEKKWFLQSEFRYGAPQHTKEFTYRAVSVPDTGSNPAFSTVTSSSLKKTFYHQLPLTFNYYIRPGWSLGAGLQWNKLFAAVSERQVSRKNNFTQTDSLISKKIINDKKDSLFEFKKNYWQAVVETQYQWRRFSFGARYSFGLEPYIRFSLPGQPVKQERNQSFQILIRYEFWKQRK